jgi:hypothetical protein
MKLEDAINKYFSRKSLVDSVCRYQLYYQIGLGNLALESIQDLDETFKKLEELNLQIRTEKVFESIYRIIIHYSHQENFDTEYEKHLRTEALAQALNDFVEADSELIGSEHFANMIFERIKVNSFFTQPMEEQFNNDYVRIIDTWEMSITNTIATQVKDIIAERFNQL